MAASQKNIQNHFHDHFFCHFTGHQHMIPDYRDFMKWFLFSIMGFLALWAPPLLGQQLEIVGTVNTDCFSPGRLDWSAKRQFNIKISGCNALLTTSNENSRILVQMQFENGAIRELVSFYGNNGTVTNAGNVDLADVPPPEGSGIPELWLAYVSGCYFQRQTNNLLEPLWCLDDPDLKKEHFKLQATWKIASNAPFLPTMVSYLSDGKSRWVDPETHQRKVTPEEPPFDQGFTNAFFEQLATTNISGMQIPTAFRFVRYYINSTNSKLEPRTLTTGTLIEVTVTPGGDSTLLPKFSGTASISDSRYALSNPPVHDFTYQAKNGEWSPTNLSRLHKRLASAEKRDFQNTSSAAAKGKTIIWVMFIASCGFAGLLWKISKVKKF